MARVSVSRDIPAAHDLVWKALADLNTHTSWMKDARSIEFTSDQQRGTGTRMEVLTVIGPLRTTDIMEVVGWEEGKSIDVRHEGLVTGTGTLGVEPVGDGSRVTWDENLTFPWWLGGFITAWLARPVLAAVWRGNLRRLEQTLVS
ncbi:MAG TPA: SRPBCC family protein [Acidimicrobiia bacterium]